MTGPQNATDTNFYNWQQIKIQKSLFFSKMSRFQKVSESFVTQLFENKFKTLNLLSVCKLAKTKTLLYGTDTIHDMLCEESF